MEVKMKMLVIAATWIWSAMVGAAWNSNLCLVSRERRCGIGLTYKLVSFTTADATRESYSKLLQDLRGHLASGNKAHDIPVMRDPSTVTESERFLLVELSNSAELSVTLAINVANAYVVAYRASDQSYFFSDSKGSEFSELFTGTKIHYLSFTGNYIDLQGIAGADRKDIPLGMSALDQAITNLYYWRSGSGTTENTVARSLLVAIQMVPEAGRFRYIEQSVRRTIKGTTFQPDEAMLSLENNWGALSTAIQQSNQGVFGRPVPLRKPDGTSFNVDSVTDRLISNLGLLLFACSKPQASRFKRSIDVEYYNNNICSVPEPTIRITGRNGLCADVKDGVYADGNPIQLRQCKSTPELNQLWTLKQGRKIQSNGKCLTTDNRVSYVMIYDCNKAVTMGANVLWEVQVDGSIIDPGSKLALSTSSGNAGSNLTMATNNYDSSQGWLASNNTTPFVTSIVGLNDLCLVQGNRTSLWLAECDSDWKEQQWALYADGSIRAQQDQNMCISCNSNIQPGSIVLISPCSGSSQQRWMFQNDGTMLNLFSGLVMDVRRSDPSLKEIIISQPTGNLSQKWLPVP